MRDTYPLSHFRPRSGRRTLARGGARHERNPGLAAPAAIEPAKRVAEIPPRFLLPQTCNLHSIPGPASLNSSGSSAFTRTRTNNDSSRPVTREEDPKNISVLRRIPRHESLPGDWTLATSSTCKSVCTTTIITLPSSSAGQVSAHVRAGIRPDATTAVHSPLSSRFQW